MRGKGGGGRSRWGNADLKPRSHSSVPKVSAWHAHQARNAGGRRLKAVLYCSGTKSSERTPCVRMQLAPGKLVSKSACYSLCRP